MKCSNCQSTDIVALQGQSYCINCGQLISEPKIPVKVMTQNAPLAVGLKPTFPRKNESLSGSRGGPSAAGMRSDITPNRKSADKTLNLKQPPVSDKEIHPIPPQATASPWKLSLSVAFLTALPATVAIAVALYLRLNSDILVFAVVPAILVTMALAITLAQAATMYGLSRRQDGRPTPASQWWQMAGQSATELIQLNILAALSLAMCVAVGIGAWHLLGQLLTSPLWLHASILAIINALLLWVALGVLVVRRLAEAAIVINDIPMVLAIRLGAGMYWKIGGHLLAATGESLVVKAGLASVAAALLAGIVWANPSLPDSARPAVYAAAIGVVLFLAIAVSLQIEVRLWVSQYRHWAPLCYPDTRSENLTTPRPLASKPS